MYGIPITEAFADVVSRANAASIASIIEANEEANGGNTIESLHYMYGHLLEIQQTLIEFNQNCDWFKKYPLAWLVEDITQTRGREGEYDTIPVRLILIMATEKEYKSYQRDAKVFKPVLRPMYEAILQAIVDSPYFDNSDIDSLRHTYTERKFWGRETFGGNEGNNLTDYVDAIDIQNLELIINTNCYNPVNIS